MHWLLIGYIFLFIDRPFEIWPILGDLPIVGQFFRDTTGIRRKRELVILVTPRILRDDQGGAYGYGYQPATPQSRDFLRQAGG